MHINFRTNRYGIWLNSREISRAWEGSVVWTRSWFYSGSFSERGGITGGPWTRSWSTDWSKSRYMNKLL